MSSWIDQSARRLLIAGALAFAVGAPTIACMGGDSATEDDGGGGDGDGDGGGDEAKSAQDRSLGNWQVQPSPDDMRLLKIINMGLNPKMNEAQFKQKLKPPPKPEEIAMFNDIKKVPANSPEAEFLKMQIKAMKDSNLEITEKKWVLSMAGDKDEWSYTVQSDNGDELKVKLDSGETNTLKFMSDDKIKVTISDPGGSMDLQFKRK